jgi:hypothetical protein
VGDEVKVTENNGRAHTFKVAGVFEYYLLLSALMAIVVLLNLDIMFVDEKKRELIVLMINGFSVKDAKAYIYRDSLARSRWPCCSMRCARFRALTSRTSTASRAAHTCLGGRPRGSHGAVLVAALTQGYWR